MGEVLPFTPRRSLVFNAAGPGHFEVPLVELGPGGSVQGAENAEIQRRALEANPMRRVARWACRTCDHTWSAPNAGACPSCHKSQPELLDEHINMAQRLK
jgi:hypothetical protein